MAKDDFYLFEDVLKELKLNESELKRMVSEGEIRAFRDADKIKFKRSDVDDIRKGKSVEPTVILPPGEIEIPSANANNGALVEEDTTSDIGATEEMLIDGEITVPSLEEDTGMADEGVTIAEEVSETIAEDVSATVAEGVGAPAGRMKRFAPSDMGATMDQFPMMMAPAIPKFKTPPMFFYLLGGAFFLLIFAGAFLVDIMRISSGKSNLKATLTKELSSTLNGIFGVESEKEIKDQFPPTGKK
ncbi:MAG: helix-turn-helix domain-containing protein [Candidatus Brocadiia bacterium]